MGRDDVKSCSAEHRTSWTRVQTCSRVVIRPVTSARHEDERWRRRLHRARPPSLPSVRREAHVFSLLVELKDVHPRTCSGIFGSLRRVPWTVVTPEPFSPVFPIRFLMLERLGLVDPLTFNPSEAFLTVLVD